MTPSLSVIVIQQRDSFSLKFILHFIYLFFVFLWLGSNGGYPYPSVILQGHKAIHHSLKQMQFFHWILNIPIDIKCWHETRASPAQISMIATVIAIAAVYKLWNSDRSHSAYNQIPLCFPYLGAQRDI